MWFLLLKVFKFGFSQAKKHKSKKSNNNSTSTDDLTNPSSFNMSQPSPPASPVTRTTKLKSYIILALHILQFVFGITVIGLYSGAIRHASESNDALPSKWVYAVIVASLACVTAVGLLVTAVVKGRITEVGTGAVGMMRLTVFAWQGVLVILWTVVFGIFAEKFVGSDQKKMRRAVWVDLVNLVMWIGSAGWAGLKWWKGNQRVGEVDKEVV
ncbi:uncharacterized protein ATNIH1004_005791 [Aspergillus tanneri]|uniref:MARVEL domain-containing protein n=1 Tax=Aspergillus tanneri TaxID=1220188 RepID=A0A5M9MJC7_9EURO|nr:uncharacterized protein ATNIH1004_005791 [Aspergillus tanneri]KAA8647108.1 hypothetical protein ATNIH1004_005791 [Aspergillus tanneri]